MTANQATQTAEAVRFLGALTSGIIGATEDQKINLKDLKYLFRIAPTVKPAFDGIAEIPSELRALSPDELQSLSFVFCESAGLDVTDADEQVARLSIDIAMKLARLFTLVRTVQNGGDALEA